jgi:hypothetical protein
MSVQGPGTLQLAARLRDSRPSADIAHAIVMKQCFQLELTPNKRGERRLHKNGSFLKQLRMHVLRHSAHRT